VYRILKPGGFFAGTVDYGRPEDGVPLCERYNKQTFDAKIVCAAPWTWVAEPPNRESKPGGFSAMVFVLQK
jgi:hypothetical protein